MVRAGREVTGVIQNLWVRPLNRHTDAAEADKSSQLRAGVFKLLRVLKMELQLQAFQSH